jgi:hypothetical protein
VLLFDIPIRGSFALLLAGAGLYLMSTIGVGLFISTISRTQQQALMSSFFFYLPAVLLSGFMFPISNMPDAAQWITYVNPLRYLLVIIRGIFLKGSGFEVLWPQFAALAVLGGLLLDNNAFDRVADVLREDDFYRHDHRLIWHQVARLIERGQPADVVTVLEALQTAGKADEAGGLVYLNALAQETPSAANIRRYAEIVRDRGILRRLITTADEISSAALNPQGKDTRQLLDQAESKIFQISEEGARGQAGFHQLPDLLGKVVERIDELYNQNNPSDVTGVPTGFVDLDRMTSGLQQGDLIIVAGRPSMGKAQPLDARVRTSSGWTTMGELAVGDALAAIDGYAALTIRGCTIRGNRARGILLNSRGPTVVEKNTFHTAGAAILFEGDARFWYEQAGVSDCVIRDNLFDNCNYGVWGQALIECRAGIDPAFRATSRYNKNIRITGNTIRAFHPALLDFYSVRGLTFTNNVVLKTDAYPPWKPAAPRYVTADCDDVTLQP